MGSRGTYVQESATGQNECGGDSQHSKTVITTVEFSNLIGGDDDNTLDLARLYLSSFVVFVEIRRDRVDNGRAG